MQPDSPGTAEWKRGWRVVLGAAVCSAFGIPLFYYVFSLFIEGMQTEFKASRGEMANIQALIVVGALVAPFVGRWLDKYGFHRVFLASGMTIVATFVWLANGVTNLWTFAACVFLIGAAGIGCGPLAYTRPINAWFWHSRGWALGLAAIGLALSTFFIAPQLATLIDTEGWRAGYWALAAIMGLVGVPLTPVLIKNAPPEGSAGPAEKPVSSNDKTHLRDRDFWLMATSLFCMAVPGAGLVSSIAPLVEEEGLTAAQAALGVSAYAVGQVLGRVIAGWFLDRVEPRIVALLFCFIPAFGLVMLAAFGLPLWAAVVAVGMVGIQQGAEIDLFAFLTARRFGIARYGAVYGWIIAMGWVGNAVGILSFGQMHDATGSYQMIEGISAALMMLGALLVALVKINPEPLQ